MCELMPGSKKFVKIIKIKDDGFVEFLFSINDPSLYVEFILPYKEFIIFCATNRVSFFTKEQDQVIQNDLLVWKYGIENV